MKMETQHMKTYGMKQEQFLEREVYTALNAYIK